MTHALRAALLASALTTLPGIASANTCTLGAVPTIPDGNTATKAEMAAAQQAVRAFLAETEEFLGCLEASSRSQGTDVSSQYDEASARMEKLAAEYNAQLRVFKSRG